MSLYNSVPSVIRPAWLKIPCKTSYIYYRSSSINTLMSERFAYVYREYIPGVSRWQDNNRRLLVRLPQDSSEVIRPRDQNTARIHNQVQPSQQKPPPTQLLQMSDTGPIGLIIGVCTYISTYRTHHLHVHTCSWTKVYSSTPQLYGVHSSY